MTTHIKIDGQGAGAMVLLCLVWSMQQIGLKATALDASPVLQIAIRSGIAAILVGVLMTMRGEKIVSASLPWRAGLLAGALFSLEYLLLGAGLGLTTSAHGVVFLYTGPLFAAVGLHWRLPSERLAPVQWVGILLAFVGIVLAFSSPSPDQAAGHTSTWRGDALCLLAGAAWGATIVLIRCSGLARASASHTTLYQLGRFSLNKLKSIGNLRRASRSNQFHIYC